MTEPRRPLFTDDDLAPVLMFVALGVLACMTPAQNDTFWHLRSGQYMWQTGSFLLTEPFSHTAYGAPLQNHWWLSQLAFYAIHTVGGPFLLTLFAGGCAFTAVLGSWRLMGRSLESRVPNSDSRVPPWEIRVALLVWLMVVTAGEWSIRPQVVSLALLVVMAHLIARDKTEWLPVVCIVWANAHAMVIFGVAMAGAVVIEAILWSRRDIRRALIVAAACAAAPTLSPLGWRYWPQVLATVSVSRELQIQEYQMPLGLNDLPFWLALAGLVWLVLSSGRSLRNHAQAVRRLMIGSLILAVAAITASRNVAFFAVFAAPAIAHLYPHRTAAARRRSPRPAGVVSWAVAGFGVLVGSLVVAVAWRDAGLRLGWQPLSTATIDAVRRCPDPIFNQMIDGGPLIWALPTRRVFVDSRMEAYPLDLLRRSRDVDLGGDHSDLFAKYHFGCAVATTGSALATRLAADRSMALVQSDQLRTVFVRRLAPTLTLGGT